jgi:hypothetical protein
MVAPFLASMWSPHFCGFNVTCTYDRDRLAGLRNVTVSLGRPDFMLMNNEFGLGHPQSYHGPWSRYQKGAGRGGEGKGTKLCFRVIFLLPTMEVDHFAKTGSGQL